MSQYYPRYNDNKLICSVEGEDIVQFTNIQGQNQKTVIGKTVKAYNELEDTTNEYYDKLVELGVIVPEKTLEEINQEMQTAMKEMVDVVKSLKSEIEELKNGSNESSRGSKELSSQRQTTSSGRTAQKSTITKSSTESSTASSESGNES